MCSCTRRTPTKDSERESEGLTMKKTESYMELRSKAEMQELIAAYESYIKLLHLDYTYGWRATRHSEVQQARHRIDNAKKKLQ